jgi:hypothetical protein
MVVALTANESKTFEKINDFVIDTVFKGTTSGG